MIETLYDDTAGEWLAYPNPTKKGDPIGRGKTEIEALTDDTRQAFEIIEKILGLCEENTKTV